MKKYNKSIMLTNKENIFIDKRITLVLENDNIITLDSNSETFCLKISNECTGEKQEIYYLLEINPKTLAYKKFKNAMLETFETIDSSLQQESLEEKI